MKETNNIEVAKLFFAAIFAGNFDRAFADFADSNFRFVAGSVDNPELEKAIPSGRTHVGQAGYMELMQQLFSEFESLSFEATQYSDAGNKVFIEGHFRFRHKQTGKIADSDWLTRFAMKNGRIVGGHFYENTYTVAAARH